LDSLIEEMSRVEKKRKKKRRCIDSGAVIDYSGVSPSDTYISSISSESFFNVFLTRLQTTTRYAVSEPIARPIKPQLIRLK
jgi:hypothetical protein